MVPYLFLSDIDGTLVKGRIGMTPGVIKAAREYCAAGGLLTVCTGRAPVSALPVAEQLGVNIPCVLYGGAALYDCTARKFLWMHSFSPEIHTSIRSVLDRFPGISVQVFTDQDIYVLRRNARFNANGVRQENVGEIRRPDEIEGNVLKLVLCGDNRAELEACRSCFPPSSCHFAFASRSFVDIVAAGAGKADAMAALSRNYDIPFSHFFCAGDAITDLPMLRLAGTSYAPANALEEVRQSVSLVVPAVQEGGMEQAFRHALSHISTAI